MTRDEELAMLKAAAAKLGEHFDTVHIFTTRYDGREVGTVFVNSGIGNWFARYGQVRDWLLREEEATRTDQHERED